MTNFDDAKNSILDTLVSLRDNILRIEASAYELTHDQYILTTTTQRDREYIDHITGALDAIRYHIDTIRDATRSLGSPLLDQPRYFNFDDNGDCQEVDEAHFKGNLDEVKNPQDPYAPNERSV